MAGILAVGELADGRPTRLTLELATLARQLAEAAGSTASVVLLGSGAGGAASEVAAHGPSVRAIESADDGAPVAMQVAPVVAALIAKDPPDLLLIGASPDGKDIAGLLVGLTDLPILVNGSGASWSDGKATVEMSTFGGRLVTQSQFTGDRGIVLV
ncbi:MAG: hypothetical protein ABIZ34_06030, partial [Candidatus Limnocylindrales bacterium]